MRPSIQELSLICSYYTVLYLLCHFSTRVASSHPFILLHFSVSKLLSLLLSHIPSHSYYSPVIVMFFLLCCLHYELSWLYIPPLFVFVITTTLSRFRSSISKLSVTSPCHIVFSFPHPHSRYLSHHLIVVSPLCSSYPILLTLSSSYLPESSVIIRSQCCFISCVFLCPHDLLADNTLATLSQLFLFSITSIITGIGSSIL